MNHDCTPMGGRWSSGAPFKITCAAYGYTVVGQGTASRQWKDVSQEAEAYRVLKCLCDDRWFHDRIRIIDFDRSEGRKIMKSLARNDTTMKSNRQNECVLPEVQTEKFFADSNTDSSVIVSGRIYSVNFSTSAATFCSRHRRSSSGISIFGQHKDMMPGKQSFWLAGIRSFQML
ncbi:hypothetical protein AJ78_01691 [Emergomyces pasteurianus Ep9510]|uniref:Uncharacterized protein n=1 Tax=Emergomyces pasteurianus Ep9510 TaxID=1447872 RepID=A0A1J9QQV4_9EURO|nr:hypothetical protein AJ78_01691 [Emergomyces pasteurianus Ep9510]